MQFDARTGVFYAGLEVTQAHENLRLTVFDLRGRCIYEARPLSAHKNDKILYARFLIQSSLLSGKAVVVTTRGTAKQLVRKVIIP